MPQTASQSPSAAPILDANQPTSKLHVQRTPGSGADSAFATPFRFLPHRRRQFLLLRIVLTLLGIPGYVIFSYARAEYYFRAAREARTKRDFAAARRYLEANLSRFPDSARDHLLLARVARQTGLTELAQSHLDSCQRLEGRTEQITLERTLIQAQQGGLSQGVESALRRRLKEKPPESDDIFEALIAGCLTSYRFSTALAYLNDWLERRPN